MSEALTSEFSEPSVPQLVLNVSYDTQQRLHVHIYDAPEQQWQVRDIFTPLPRFQCIYVQVSRCLTG